MINKKLGVAGRLQKARVDAGYKTARSFIEKHHLSQSTYSLHETGQRSIGMSAAVKYCDYLNIDINWLLMGEFHQDSDQKNSVKNIQDQDTILSDDMLKQMTLVSKVKRVGVRRDLVDTELLGLLIEELLNVYSVDCFNVGEISEAIAGIYKNVVQTTEDKAGRKLLIKPLINTYKIAINVDFDNDNDLKVSNLG